MNLRPLVASYPNITVAVRMTVAAQPSGWWGSAVRAGRCRSIVREGLTLEDEQSLENVHLILHLVTHDQSMTCMGEQSRMVTISCCLLHCLLTLSAMLGVSISCDPPLLSYLKKRRFSFGLSRSIYRHIGTLLPTICLTMEDSYLRYGIVSRNRGFVRRQPLQCSFLQFLLSRFTTCCWAPSQECSQKG